MNHHFLTMNSEKAFNTNSFRQTIGSLQKVFEEAFLLFFEERGGKQLRRGENLPPVYVDCGNTLFEKSGEVPVINAPLFHFLIALKEGGYDVHIMSDEPRHYLGILQNELCLRGKSERFFEDDYGINIVRKQTLSPEAKGLILIDNDIFSVPVKIKRRIYPDDTDFLHELEAYKDMDKAVLPDSLKPEAFGCLLKKTVAFTQSLKF